MSPQLETHEQQLNDNEYAGYTRNRTRNTPNRMLRLARRRYEYGYGTLAPRRLDVDEALHRAA